MIIGFIKFYFKAVWTCLLLPYYFLTFITTGDTRSMKQREYDAYMRKHKWDTPDDWNRTHWF